MPIISIEAGSANLFQCEGGGRNLFQFGGRAVHHLFQFGERGESPISIWGKGSRKVPACDPPPFFWNSPDSLATYGCNYGLKSYCKNIGCYSILQLSLLLLFK